MKPFEIVETNSDFGDLTDRSETNLLVVHHVGEITRDVSAEEIHGWHKNNGWSGIGYHFVIRKDGTIERGRPQDTIGAHAQGFNSVSIGINVVGDFEQEDPTAEQVESIARLIAYLVAQYGELRVCGHRDLMSTDCPGANLYCLLPELGGKVEYYKANGLDA